jgi:hypothetical protein
MSAIGTFSTYGTDQVSLVNSATLTGQSYFRNLSYMTPEHMPPAAPMIQMSHEKSVKKEQLERVFAGAALSIVRLTAIYALLQFKEIPPTCSTKFDLAHPKSSMRAFAKWCKESQYINWDMMLLLTLVYCSKYTGIVESQCMSIEVDN